MANDSLVKYSVKTVGANDTASLTIDIGTFYVVQIKDGGRLALTLRGQPGYYGQAQLMITTSTGASVSVSPAAGQSADVVDGSFLDRMTHLCSIKFLGGYSRFYIVDRWT